MKIQPSNIRNRLILVAGLMGACATSMAATVVVTPDSPLCSNPVLENRDGGSSAISITMPNTGNGSLEMTGDRLRFVGLGDFSASSSNLGLLDTVRELTYQRAIAASSQATLHPDYTPALRLHIFDGAQRSELI